MSAQPFSVAGTVVLLAGGCGLVAWAFALRGPGPDAAASELCTSIEQRLRERAAGLASRVATLAELPPLAAAVATDEATVRDLTDDELAFRPRPGETLTIAQRFGDGRTAHLITLPGGATPVVRSTPGLELQTHGGELVLVQTARIYPRERVGELVGMLTVTTPVPLADVIEELRRRGAGGRLEVNGSALPLAEGPADGRRKALARSLSLPAGTRGSARLVLAGLGPEVHPALVYLAGGGGVLLLVTGAVVARRRAGDRSSSRATPAASTPRARGGRPSRIGRYQILRQLGAGGMAEVYLARGEGEAGFEKLVALKLLQPSLALRPTAVEKFLDEARVAAGLDHPNIVQTHDLGRWGEEYFIAMEYIDGTDLNGLGDILRERGLQVPLPVALTILRRLCDGLHAAHEAVAPDGRPLELVHRDVKAANVFVSRTGVTKIGDFGIAKISHAMRSGKTEIGQVKGTPGYMSPEHRMGGPVDRRADVFGVAALAYELFTGKPVNLDTMSLIDQGLDGWPHLAPISTVRPEAPPALDALVSRGLAYDREQRIPDCAVFDHELEALARTVGVADDKAVGRFVSDQLRWAGQSTPPPVATGHAPR